MGKQIILIICLRTRYGNLVSTFVPILVWLAATQRDLNTSDIDQHFGYGVYEAKWNIIR